MNIWRMKLRAGEAAKGGENMWPACRERGIASFTHSPIYNTDLTNLNKTEVDQAVRGTARPSIFQFAWEIKGGDVIYVGDAEIHEIVGRGTVVGELGKRAYRYNAGKAMAPPSSPNTPWRHEVPVRWEKDFAPFSYKDPAPLSSVYRLRMPDQEEQTSPADFTNNDGGESSNSLLNELAYQREIKASRKTISPLHNALSNQFRSWLKREFDVNAIPEKNRIDVTFTVSDEKHLAELKICYCDDTKHAIREALGQLFEYNHYPSYVESQVWWLVLDCEPSTYDRKYISALRQKYALPLTLAWCSGSAFKAFPALPL
jgi:hypothetical protein